MHTHTHTHTHTHKHTEYGLTALHLKQGVTHSKSSPSCVSLHRKHLELSRVFATSQASCQTVKSETRTRVTLNNLVSHSMLDKTYTKQMKHTHIHTHNSGMISNKRVSNMRRVGRVVERQPQAVNYLTRNILGVTANKVGITHPTNGNCPRLFIPVGLSAAS